MPKLSTNFTRAEFACGCGCGLDTVDAELITLLELIRRQFGKAVHVNSGIRCAKHNRDVGGSEKSQHLLGKAADIWIRDVDPLAVAEFVVSQFSTCYGVGKYNNFTHVDVRDTPAMWGW